MKTWIKPQQNGVQVVYTKKNQVGAADLGQVEF